MNPQRFTVTNILDTKVWERDGITSLRFLAKLFLFMYFRVLLCFAYTSYTLSMTILKFYFHSCQSVIKQCKPDEISPSTYGKLFI